MDFSQCIVFGGVVLFAMALALYVKARVDDKINAVAIASEARDTSLAKKFVELRDYMDNYKQAVADDITRVLTKTETCYQLAHQASVAAKNLGEFDSSKPIHLTLDPFQVILGANPQVGKIKLKKPPKPKKIKHKPANA